MKEEGRRKSENKNRDLKILLSAHARISEAYVFYILIRRPQTAWPVNSFLVSFNSL